MEQHGPSRISSPHGRRPGRSKSDSWCSGETESSVAACQRIKHLAQRLRMAKMTKTDPTFRAFIGSLLRHGTNLYSGLTFVAALVLAALGLAGERFTLSPRIPVALPLALACFSLLVAAYHSWKDVVLRLPGQLELLVEVRGALLSAPIKTGLGRLADGKVWVQLEICNPSDETIYVTDILLSRWDVPADLFIAAADPVALSQSQKPPPFEVAPRKRRSDISVTVQVTAAAVDDSQFVQALKSTDTLNLQLTLVAEDSRRQQVREPSEVQIDMSGLKSQLIEVWKAQGLVELLAAAGKWE